MLIGILVLLLLLAFACWEILSRWLVYRRLQLHGVLVQAHVTEIKREGHLVTRTSGGIATFQTVKYEHFLSAEWQDPFTQQRYLFRSKIPDTAQFHVGAPIMVEVNLKNPQEYRLLYSGRKRPTKKSSPQPQAAQTEYQQGYQASEHEIQTHHDIEAYEQPKASYPLQLPEQKNYYCVKRKL